MASNDAMISELAVELRRRDWRMCSVESCTGGWVAQQLTDVAGSSDWFECGWVTYSNDAKMRDVGVRAETLDEYGAVSTETAAEMAVGAARVAGVSVAVSITGVAGPGGGSLEKPVGTVCFGWQINGEVNTQRQLFDGDRRQVREQSVRHVLQTLLADLQRLKH